MIIFGYAKDYHYTNDGTLMIKVRIPSIHGPYKQSDYRGKQIRNYTLDADLPYIQSVLLPHLPIDGEVVAMTSLNESNNEWFIVGLTGGSYRSGMTSI